MSLIDELKNKLKEKNVRKRIVLPEGNDDRILASVDIILKDNLIDIILLGDSDEINKKHPLTNVTIINPKTSSLTDNYIKKLYEKRKDKGMTLNDASNLILNDYMYFACMLVLDNKADGIVSGINHTTSNTLRPALQLIKAKDNVSLVSSFFLIETNATEYGDDGIFLFSDCGLNQNPDSNCLSLISKASSDSFISLIEKTPYIAILSHSTYDSSNHPMVDKVKEAVEIAKKNYPDLNIDGPLQLDSAISKRVASIKCPSSTVAGKSNILIFPDIDSGNIGYKLVEYLAHAKAYGPLTQGMKYPVNDLSRGSSVDDIVGVIIITALQD